MEIKIMRSCIFFKFIISTSVTYSYPAAHESRDSIVLDYTNYNSFQPLGAGSYSFGYEIEDPEYHNIQYRDEERLPNGTVTGSYGWVKPDGNIITVRYIADEKGYRASVQNSEGQLKTYGQPIPPFLQQPKKSTTLLNAANSLDLYNKQTVQDQRYRPIDLLQNFKNSKANNQDVINNYLTDTDKLADGFEHSNNIEPDRTYFYYDSI